MSILPGLLLLGVLWGLSPSIAKLALAEGVAPLAFGFGAALCAALLLYALCRMRGQRIPCDGAHLRHYAVAGLVGFALANLVAYSALRHIPAGFFALLMPLVPMLTMLGAAVIGQEMPTRRRLAGTLMGLGGVGLAMVPGAALPQPGLLGWAMLAALTPLCFAIANLAAVRLAPQGTPPLPIACGALFAAAGFLALFGLAAGQLSALPSWRALLLVPAQAAVSALAYLIYFRLIAVVGSVVTSQSGYVITVAGVLWGALLFNERMGWLTLPAAALVLGGLWLVGRK